MDRNLVGSIYGQFSIKSAHLVIHLQTWPSQAILVSDGLVSKNLLIIKPNDMKFGKKHLKQKTELE
jgi:nucleoside diphosphate kinase